MLRYDTTGNFQNSSSWSAYDATNIDGLNTQGYVGAEFDGQYVYFIPYQQGTFYHAIVLRYDTTKTFKDSASWAAYNAGATSGLNTKGYKYATKDTNYIYFTPYNCNTAFSGTVLRYKWNQPTAITLLSFTAASTSDGIILTWKTGSEIENAGFHIWRSNGLDEGYMRITSLLIPAQGSVSSGYQYSYTDERVLPGEVYYYKLEDIDYQGKTCLHGPISIEYQP